MLARTAPGLFWVAVLFSALLAVQRSFALEAADGGATACACRGSTRPASSSARRPPSPCSSLALEVVLGVGVVVLYGSDIHGPLLLLATCVLATAGLAAAGTVYGVLAAGLKVRETLLPLLVLPVVAPVLLAATRAWEAALDGRARLTAGRGCASSACSPSSTLAFGVLAFGPLLEEA